MKKRTTILLCLEAAAFFALSLYAYQLLGGSWALFAVLFLLPDVGMLGYLRGPRVGAIAYNICHFYGFPVVLILLGHIFDQAFWQLLGLIWFAHISFDRMLGYGLKDDKGFHYTHLGILKNGLPKGASEDE